VGVPGVGGLKGNVLGGQAEPIADEPVNPRVRLEDPDLLDRKHMIEETGEPRVVDLAASIRGDPFESIAVENPAVRNCRSTSGTSGNGSSAR
jgi:hypothetical protein